MSSIENQDANNFTTGSAHRHYRNIPLDLTTSPLEKYYQDMYLSEMKEQELSTDTTTAASSDESLRHYSRAKPIWIPGALDANKPRHNKRKKRPIFSVALGTQTHNSVAQEPAFIVGSLVDRPPAPWPASFTLPHDDSRCKARSSHHQDDDSASDSVESDDILFDCESDAENTT
ncbi:hypothetical protein PS6_009970 [Mucor atramentarius]